MMFLELLKAQFNQHVEARERRPGLYQLALPLYHEDGDMVEIYLEEDKSDSNKFTITDLGTTLMRLSYTFEIDTENKRKIFNQILSEAGASEDGGTIFFRTGLENLYITILQLHQVISKISTMRLYRRDISRSAFYEEVNSFVEDSLGIYHPKTKAFPIDDRDDLEVDFRFDLPRLPVFLFAAKDASKLRLSTISALEFQKHGIDFQGFMVHENFETLGRKDQARSTSVMDKQFTTLEDFRDNAPRVFKLAAGF